MSSVAEYAVIWKLMQTTAVTDLVVDRITPLHGAQSSDTPRIVVLRPPGQMNPNHSQGSIGVAYTPVIVACIGATYDESRSLCQPVCDALDPEGSPWTGSVFWNGIEVASCVQDDSFDKSALQQFADEIGMPMEFVTFGLEHQSEPSS